MRAGFTLLEVVVSLLLLQIGIFAAAGTLVVASRSLAEASHLERGVLELEGVLDSLSGAAAVGSGSRAYGDGTVDWSVDAEGRVLLRLLAADSSVSLEVSSAVSTP